MPLEKRLPGFGVMAGGGNLLTIVGIPSAHGLHGYIGFVFGSLKARQWWESDLMPIIFLFSAIVSGIALLIVLYVVVSKLRRVRIDHDCLKGLIFALWGFLMLNRNQGDFAMSTLRVLTVSGIFMLLSPSTFAEEVTLPAPVLEWAVYIVLIFAVCVAIGISIFMKGKYESDDSMGDLLDEKNPVIHSVHSDISVTECINRMNELRIGAMLVMVEDQLLGIFAERDAITRVLGAGLDPVSTQVSTVMTNNPVWVSTSTTLEEAMSIITNQHIRHLPVIESGKVLGMVSSGDLTNRLVDRQK